MEFGEKMLRIKTLFILQYLILILILTLRISSQKLLFTIVTVLKRLTIPILQTGNIVADNAGQNLKNREEISNFFAPYSREERGKWCREEIENLLNYCQILNEIIISTTCMDSKINISSVIFNGFIDLMNHQLDCSFNLK